MRKVLMTAVGALMAAFIAVAPAKACTSVYVGSDLTKDGSAIYGRTEDIGNQDKVFKVIPAENVGANAMWKDKSGATDFTGEIGVTTTYRYTVCRDSESCKDGYFGEIGINEKGVSMSATTTASSRLMSSVDPYRRNGTGVCEEIYVDYILCQASTAKEGVQILGKAIEKYGVDYTGDGVFIADNNEVWYMEILSGHHYCAIKMPTNKAALIPNCLVIGDVDLDSADVIASKGLVDITKEAGIYKEALKNPSVNDINIKLTFTGTGYSASNADRIRGGQYILTGKDNTAIYTDEYQDIFFDVPAKDVTIEKLYQLQGTQYEEIADFAAATPAGKIFRAIGVSTSVECHLVQIRKNMPAAIASVQWMSLASAAYSPMMPHYSALLLDTAPAYKKESIKKTKDYTTNRAYMEESAYHEFYRLDSLARGDAAGIGLAVKTFNRGYLAALVQQQKTFDEKLAKLYAKDPAEAAKQVTAMDIDLSNYTLSLAKDLYTEMEPKKGQTDVQVALKYSAAKFDLPDEVTPVVEKALTKSVVTLKNIKSKKAKISWKKVDGAAGYQIQFSLKKSFAGTKRSYTTKKLTLTAGKLKKGKKYYARVRAYKVKDSKIVYGPWSATKTVKIKK